MRILKRKRNKDNWLDIFADLLLDSDWWKDTGDH